MPGLNWCQLINFWCHLINIWGHVLLTIFYRQCVGFNIPVEVGQEASYLLEAGPHKLSLFLVLVVATSPHLEVHQRQALLAQGLRPHWWWSWFPIYCRWQAHTSMMKLFQLVDQRNSFLKVTVLSEAGATMTPPFVYGVTLPNISWYKWARRYICMKYCHSITLLSASCREF